ncbi:MAG: CHRD domain-containing protein [Gaiellaceae bacterium]
MKKLVAMLALVAVAGLATAALSLAGTKGVSWSAKLTAAQDVPKQVKKDAAAHGQFTATLTGKTLKWKLTFAKLTGPAAAAHIHLGAMGKAGNVVVALCGPCKSGLTGTAKITGAVAKDFTKHLLYVNVHTAKNAAGEIRGQLGG